MSMQLLVTLYLIALVMANLLITHYGQLALLVTSVTLIPFDYAVRVRLQELWIGAQLWVRVSFLIGAGSILTVLTVPGSGRVALASVTAFAGGVLVGVWSYTYARLYCSLELTRLISLAWMAAADSVLFSYLAFDDVDGWVLISQVIMKWLVSSAIVLSRVLEHGGSHET